MHYSVESLKQNQVYNLLIGLVAPRPIAWVTSLNEDNSVNAAPFSAYNYVSVTPPMVVLGIAPHPTKEDKDTLANIRRNRHFVINVVNQAHLEAMNITATEFEQGTSEIEEANLQLTPSQSVLTPRIASVPAALECELHDILKVERSHIILGRVKTFYIQEEYLDPAGPYIRSESLHAIGRMNGLGSYVKTEDAFIYQPRFATPEEFYAKKKP